MHVTAYLGRLHAVYTVQAHVVALTMKAVTGAQITCAVAEAP